MYGKLVKRTKPVTKNYTAIVKAKTKLAAQLVSNCHTAGRREDYVKELQNYMSVDVYGACGNLKCPRSSDDACIQVREEWVIDVCRPATRYEYLKAI